VYLVWVGPDPWLDYVMTVMVLMVLIGLFLGIIRRGQVAPLCVTTVAMLLFVSDLVLTYVWCTFLELRFGWGVPDCTSEMIVPLIVAGFLAAMAAAVIAGWFGNTPEVAQSEEAIEP